MTLAKLQLAIRSFLSVPSDDERLLQAQFKVFSKQIPLMYLILMINMWALAFTHLSVAPVVLSIYVPLLLSVLGLSRIVSWLKLSRSPLDPAKVRAVLVRTNRLTGIITIVFTAWSLAIYFYGSAYQQMHVAFFMAITVVGCICCLTHLRSAAFMVSLIVNTIFIIFFATTANPVFVALSVNVLLVSLTLLVVLMGNYRDFRLMVAAQEKAEKLGNENFQLANRDSLTDLPNRRCFFARLEKELAAAARSGSAVTLGIIDLDGFKPVNDTYGHSSGDDLLVAVACRLTRTCKDRAFVSRLGGDEFALILSGHWPEQTLITLGRELIAAIEQPVVANGDTLTVSASVGFATSGEHCKDIDSIFDQADYALYSAKRNQRGQAVIFSDNHLNSIQMDRRVDRLMHSADFQSELFAQYQPIVRAQDGKTIGFEALARWSTPELGMIPPSRFIPVAERTGLISEITQILLVKSLKAARLWPDDVRLSFNLSSKDIGSPEGVLRIISIVMDSEIDPSRIDFEITETAMIQDFQQAKRAIVGLRNLGCGISLDDFGTGFSSLSHLYGLELTKIKIDQSFVRNLHENPAGFKIVKSLLALSKDMQLDCVVEGVETAAELSKLQDIGATYIQGYYYSRPMNESDIHAYLQRDNTLSTVGSHI